MDLHTPHDRLVKYISVQGAKARDSRQIAQRLRQLLPDRLEEIRQQLAKPKESPSIARRRALVSPMFNEVVSEIIEVNGSALEARIQYETHLMLIGARQTLRLLKNRRL